MIRLQPSKRLTSLGTIKAQIRTPSETPRTSHHYGNEWYKGRRSSIWSHYAYNRALGFFALGLFAVG